VKEFRLTLRAEQAHGVVFESEPIRKEFSNGQISNKTVFLRVLKFLHLHLFLINFYHNCTVIRRTGGQSLVEFTENCTL
jgi:hypothetical protein